MEQTNNILTITTEKLFYTETEAYSYLEESRRTKNIENSGVKYKKATKTTDECWIVTIKERLHDAKDLVFNGGGAE